jgi:hypothetical protein
VLKPNRGATRKSQGGDRKYLAVDLLSPEAIEIARRDYQAAVLEEAKRTHQDTAELDALRAEEVLLRKMMRARTLSPDVAQAARKQTSKGSLDRQEVSRQSRAVFCSDSRALHLGGEKL